MLKPITKKTWMTLAITAFISIIVYFTMSVLTALDYETIEGDYLSKQQAIDIVTKFVNDEFGFVVKKAEAYHYAEKDYTGYIAKYKLQAEHREQMESFVPNDQFRVNVRGLGNDYSKGSVFINIITGKIVGWDFTVNSSFIEDDSVQKLITSKLSELDYPVKDEIEFSKHLISSEEELSFSMSPAEKPLAVEYHVSSSSVNVKDAELVYKASVIQLNGDPVVSKLIPTIELPKDYLSMIKKQDRNANIWTYGVYMIISFALGILAIIYAILYRKHTSFKYGAILTAIATIIAVIVNYSMTKSELGLSGEMLTDSLFNSVFMGIFVAFSILVGSISYYFSFVAGDGLWKAQGFNLWPKFNEPGYGQHVWDSMKIGYLMALIGLGIQSIIFYILSATIDTWSANDTSQSLLNFEFAWLYPLIAWFAAITEEVVFRFFGVAIFRRWFKNTWLAALIPTVAWAAAHTLYPFYPTSTRVIELIIIGYLFTWVMMRFGFIAGMFMHAIFNSLLIGYSLMFSDSTLNIVSAIFFIVLPVFIAFVIKKLHARKKNTKETNVPPYPHLE